MNRKSVTNMYQQQHVMTASPSELTLMLYNACIKNIKIGIESINKGRIETANVSIKKSQRIIKELSSSLDMRYPISAEMKPLYDFIYAKLVDGNIKKDIYSLNNALELVEDFRGTWFQVIKAVDGCRKANVV